MTLSLVLMLSMRIAGPQGGAIGHEPCAGGLESTASQLRAHDLQAKKAGLTPGF